jgi:hypothetical protein
MKTKTFYYNPNPMREPFVIKNDKMVSLIQEIFIVVDQAWSDTEAYEIALMIEEYIKENEK